jgi:hypothetical protein
MIQTFKCRFVKLDYTNKMRWLPLLLLLFVKLWFVVAPMIIFVEQDPAGIFLVLFSITVVTCLSSLLTLFMPSIVYMHQHPKIRAPVAEELMDRQTWIGQKGSTFMIKSSTSVSELRNQCGLHAHSSAISNLFVTGERYKDFDRARGPPGAGGEVQPRVGVKY